MRVRCRCCHREERHGAAPGAGGGAVEVVVPGGARRPPDPVQQSIVRYLLAIEADGEHLVDACPACDMPRSGPAPGQARWKLAPFEFVDDHFEEDGVRVPGDVVRRRIAALHPEPEEPRSVRWMQVAMLLPMAAPILFWAFLFGFWINYATRLATSP